jgi:hypothetical protein
VGPRAGLDRCGKSRPHRETVVKYARKYEYNMELAKCGTDRQVAYTEGVGCDTEL